MPQTDIRRRSRTGCRACRHQHRKCDEQRPKCSSCRIRGIECDYQRPLKWTGLCSSETFSQQNPTAPCTSSDLPVGECAASSPALPLQYEFEVADRLLAHTSGGSTDPNLDIDPPGLQTYHHTSPPAYDQDDSAVQGHFNSSSEELETVNGNLLDDNNESGFSEQPLTKPTETSETTAESSFLGDSETGAINNILMGTLLSQVFESSNDEMTFAYYLNRTSSVLMVELDSIETHMTYALYLIQHLGCFKQPPRSVFMRTLVYRFAMVDVMLAFIQSRHPQAPLDFFMYQNNIDQLIDDEEPSFRDMHGCHQRVLSFLAQIAILSAHIAESGSPRSEIQVKGYNLETEMRLWGRIYYGGMAAAASSDLPIGSSRRQFNSRADLEVVCECFYWTAHILLLKRVFLDDTESTRVQLICKYLFRLMDSLVSGCGPDSSLPFPFYIAACEAITTDDQDWVRKKHGEMLAAYRDPTREALMASVERIWAKPKAEAAAV
ncbi:transcriptional regulator [Fusarium sp. NRRL 25303]|nr:transcriptional regulator [Fusarium sp. NRRL 25303]